MIITRLMSVIIISLLRVTTVVPCAYEIVGHFDLNFPDQKMPPTRPCLTFGFLTIAYAPRLAVSFVHSIGRLEPRKFCWERFFFFSQCVRTESPTISIVSDILSAPSEKARNSKQSDPLRRYARLARTYIAVPCVLYTVASYIIYSRSDKRKSSSDLPGDRIVILYAPETTARNQCIGYVILRRYCPCPVRFGARLLTSTVPTIFYEWVSIPARRSDRLLYDQQTT